MKKFLLTLGVAAMALSSSAATRILYQQNFETVNTPAEAGWAKFEGASMSIGSNPYTKFLDIQLGQNNGRTASVTWGEDIFLENGESVLEDGVYNMEFDFQLVTPSNNQWNGSITVFTNHAPVTNQPYRTPWSPAGYWQNYVFNMAQVNGVGNQFVVNGGTIESEADGVTSYAIDYSDPKTFVEGTWYKVNLTVDTENRTVEYLVTTPATGDEVASGTMTVPAENVAGGGEISMFAQGLEIMLARYQTAYFVDNISITAETSYDWANAPTISLTGLGQNEDGEEDPRLRGYTIYFNEGETLHIIGTDGKEEEPVEYDEYEGAYVYWTTTSGTLKAWTTYGDAKSEEVVVEVDCTPIVLPAAVANISAVGEGFEKTYTLTVDNSDVPMRPDIFISYEFVGKGGEKISADEQTTGCKLTVTEEGVLTITTASFGFQSTTTEVKNDSEFEVKKVYDFARLTKEEIDAKIPGGEWKISNTANTSGFNSWTGRGELFYYVAGTEHEDAEGNMVYDKYLPFGFVSEDNTTQVLNYYVLDRSAIAETTSGQYFDGLTIFPERGKVAEGGLPNIGMMLHIGLYNDQTTNNNNNVYINDLDESDFVVINKMGNYGRDGASNHPICSTDEEYYKLLEGSTNVVIPANTGTLNEDTGLYSVVDALYRIDTALTKITIFCPAGKSGVEGVEAAEVEGDNWYYSIDGVRMAEPTRPGIYIHNGKKVIVK